MGNMMNTVLDALNAMPWLLLVGAAVLILLPIIIMSATQASAKKRWEQESADQIDRYETVSRKVRELNDRVEEKDKEIKQLKASEEALNAEKTELSDQGQAMSTRLDEQGKTLSEKDIELENLHAAEQVWASERNDLTEKNQTLSAELDEKAAALTEKADELDRLHAAEQAWAAERESLTEKNQALSAELKDTADALAEKNQTLDKLYADQESWDRQKNEILTSAHEAAEKIIDEASRRLAESEEEVRKNRLIAAGSLNDARRRISDMLLSAASELSKGLPSSDNATPIGYAPVYSIQDTDVDEEKVEEKPEE